MKSERRAFWERVFAAHDSSLRGFLRRRVTGAWDVQDLAQEVYARMLCIDEKSAGSIANPRAYLFTVASNLVKEHAVMRSRHRLDVGIDQVMAALASTHGSTEDMAEQELRKRRVAEALDRLPPRCKAVLLMQHRDGMTYREIASRLDVSTHMVKKYVVKALAQCRNDLAKEK